MAKESGLSSSTIANLFRRNTVPTIPTLEIICDCFGITLSQFFAENELVELDPEQLEMFNRWRLLTSTQKTMLSDLVNSYYKDK